MKKNDRTQLIIILALVFTGILTLLPFYLTIINSFKHSLQIIQNIWKPDLPVYVTNYSMAWKYIAKGMMNSFIVSTFVTCGCLILSAPAGYTFARFEFPGKHILYFFIIMLLMIPGFATLIPQFILVRDMGMLNTYKGMILPVIAGQSVLPVILFRTQFESLPKSLFECAQIEGASELKAFAHIAIPLSKAMVGTATIIIALHAWNNFIWPMVAVSNKNLQPVIIAMQYISENPKEGIGPKLAGYITSSLPLILLFAVATKPFIRGITSGAIKA